MTRFSAVVRTNIRAMSCPEEFLKAFSEYLCDVLDVDAKNIILELHTNVTIIRGGNFEKAMNIDVHHNSDDINKATKCDIAEKIARFMNDKLKIHQDRTLVLYFDTRKCTGT